MVDISVIGAIYRYRKYGDLEPIKEAIEKTNQHILADKEVKKIIRDHLDFRPLSKGRVSEDVEKRRDQVCNLIAYLRVFEGLPEKPNRKNSSATQIAAEKFKISEEVIKTDLKKNNSKYRRRLEYFSSLQDINSFEILKRAAFYHINEKMPLYNSKQKTVCEVICEELQKEDGSKYKPEEIKKIIKINKKGNCFKFYSNYFKELSIQKK